MSSSSDNSSSSSSDEEVKKTKTVSSGSSDSEVEARKKRLAKSSKKTIESGGSSETDSDDEKQSSSRKRTQAKKKTTKRKRHSSGSTDDDRVDDSLFANAEDKARWKALSELEKEQEFFERMEARENQRAREEIAQQLKAKKKEEGRKGGEKKRKIQSSDDDDEKPAAKSSPHRFEDSEGAEFHKPSDVNRKHKEKNAMAELKQKRKEIEKKNAKNTTLSIDAVFGMGSSGSSSSSSSSASSRSSSRSSSRTSSPTRAAEAEKVVKKEVDSLEELVKARLSRFKLCKIVHAPFFNETVVGGYVRVGLGTMSGSDSKYKLWQICEVEETAKIYDVDGKRTNKGLKCKHGSSVRVFRIAYVSNSEFTRSEFEEWMNAQRATNSVPTMDVIEKKEKDIKEAMNHHFSNEEVDQMIKEKARFQKVPQNFAMRKAELSKQKEIAQQMGDLMEAEKIQRKINEIEKHADELDKTRSGDLSAIAFINYRNRTSNKNEVLSGRFKMEQDSQDDPFTRKKGGMKIVSGSKSRGDGTLSASASATNLVAQDAKEEPAPKPVQKQEKRKSTNMYELHSSAASNINFDIDLEKLIGSTKLPKEDFSVEAPPNPLPFQTDSKSRGLSLADYRRRKAESSQSAATTAGN